MKSIKIIPTALAHLQAWSLKPAAGASYRRTVLNHQIMGPNNAPSPSPCYAAQPSSSITPTEISSTTTIPYPTKHKDMKNFQPKQKVLVELPRENHQESNPRRILGQHIVPNERNYIVSGSAQGYIIDNAFLLDT